MYHVPDHWFALSLLGVAALLGLPLVFRRAPALVVFSAAFALAGAGGLLLPLLDPRNHQEIAQWILYAVLGGFLTLLLILIWTSGWSPGVAWSFAGLGAFGIGGLGAPPVQHALKRLVAILGTMDLLEWRWLLLLVSLVPLLVVSWPGLGIGMGRRDPGVTRRRIAFGLRSLLIGCVALALAEPRLNVPYDHTTVLFVLDRSLSVPEDRVAETEPDRRWQRIRKFMNDAVRQRPRGSKRDQVGLIVFGRKPRLELMPGDAPRFNLTEITSLVDGSATDVAAALQLAMASFPPNSSKRIVLLSDGNENRGSAANLATLARASGVQIDVVPLGAGQRKENEVLVERIDAPVNIERGAQLPLKVWVRSYHPGTVSGNLVVRQISERGEKQISNRRVGLELGLNPFPIPDALGDQEESYTYEAEFQPDKLEGDRPQNNRAATHVIARGRRRVLLLEAEAGQHQRLLDTLRDAGRSRFQVESRTVAFLGRFPDPDHLSAWLSNFDSVILANIPADRLTEDQQEAIRANTHDQGCGLVMIGGPESYGAGGWHNTAIEKALPVDSDIKGIETDDKSGLVLIMHASEMAEGNMWQKRIAKLAIERLSPTDHVGILHYAWNVQWHIAMQEIGDGRGKLLRQVDRLEPGDMPDFDPALQMALDALTDKKRNLSRRHVILISDGDPLQNNKGLLVKLRQAKVTVTTVGVATHGAPQDQLMRQIAVATKGQCYLPKKASDLPAIYIKETRLISQSFLHEKRFEPRVNFRAGPTAGFPDRVPDLRGFVRTTKKASSVPVEEAMSTPPIAGQTFPLLASWQYGLGKSIAFTSDAGEPKLWCRDWAEGPRYAQLWEQTVYSSLRPVESKNLTLTSDYRDGRIRIVVEARTDAGEPELYLSDLKAYVTTPRSGPDVSRAPLLRFEQKSAGVYEAQIQAEEAGSYFIGFKANRRRVKDGKETVEPESVRGSVTVPYAAEFADLESNPDLLEQLREETGGRGYADDAEDLTRAAREGTVFRPGLPGSASQQGVWHWLLFTAAVLLLFDVALRRLALERLGIGPALNRLWERLRGRGMLMPVMTTLDRLQSRKAKVGEELAARRFEGLEAAAIPMLDRGEKPSARPGSPPAAPAPQAEAEPEDFTTRLLRAKKRVWKDRDEKG